MRRLLLGLVVSSSLVVACQKAGGSKSGAGSGDPPKLASNATVLEHLQKIGEGCTVRAESASVYGCKAGQDNALREWVAQAQPKDAFETFAGVIRGTDDKARAVAIASSNGVFSRIDHTLRKANATEGAATVFLDALAKDDAIAPVVAATATHLANLAGERDRLLEVVSALKSKPARNEAYRAMMMYGRLEVLPTLQAAAKVSDHTVAALAAPREMHDWTAKETAAVCPWAKGYLGDERLPVAAEAGNDMVRCKGEWVDALLDEGDKRLAAKQFKAPLSQVFREICFQMMKGVTGAAGQPAQCTRTFAFLEKVVNDASVESAVRGMALWNIYYQRRDQATLDLMRKYQRHPDPEIQKRAKEAIDSLTTTYKLK